MREPGLRDRQHRYGALVVLIRFDGVVVRGRRPAPLRLEVALQARVSTAVE
ncbi:MULTISPECIES: hypothetical protein [Cryobacterium]|uniref:hypothetical protein n=1 Tax=Cryobacterium TaxID=69578 RepID=UPI0013FDADEB|nr:MULTISPECIES: hypothetical protein [Cryobacterium]